MREWSGESLYLQQCTVEMTHWQCATYGVGALTTTRNGRAEEVGRREPLYREMAERVAEGTCHGICHGM